MRYHKSPALLGVGMSVIAGLIFMPFARLGVDAHHDGIMFASAVAVKNGYKVQGEVYSQYGPIVTWLQAIQLYFFGQRIIVLKIFSIFALAIATGFSTYFFAKRLGWRTALTTSLIWVGCFPAFDDSLMIIPWSSDYLLLCFGTLLVLTTFIQGTSDFNDRLTRFAIGFVLAMGIFIRINSGIPVALMSIALICILCTARMTKQILFGFVAGVFLVLSYFVFTGGLAAWFEQTIIFPRKLYLGIMLEGGLNGLRGNAVVNGPPAIGVVLILYFLVKNLKLDQFKNRSLTLLSSMIGLFSAVFLYWLFGSNFKFGPLEPRLLLWGVIPIAVVFIPVAVREMFTQYRETSVLQPIIFASVAFGGLIQLFPVVDRRHLWWATLPALGYIVGKIHEKLSAKSGALFLVVLVSLLAPQSVSNALDSTRLHRQPIPNVPTLKGSLVGDDFFAAFNLQFKALNEYQLKHGSRPVLNLCMDGYFATVGDNFKMPDPYYVYWPFPRQVWSEEKRQTFVKLNEPFIWFCPPILNYSETAAAYGYRVIPRDICIRDDPKFGQWPYIGQLAVPLSWSTLAIDGELNDASRCKKKT